MARRSLRIATTGQLERSAREAGFDTYLLPPVDDLDSNRPLQTRLSDGAVFRPFLEKHDIELVIDFNTDAMTFVPTPGRPGEVMLTTAAVGIPYVSLYLDPVTSTMGQVPWESHWQILESPSWIKCLPEKVHGMELIRLGVPNVITLPMAAANDDFPTQPPVPRESGAPIVFMGHPASSWFRSQQPVLPHQLFAALTAAAVRADMPEVAFHQIYYDLYGFAEPPRAGDDLATRARKAAAYFSHKFPYNAYLAIKQRDRFARFLKLKIADAFELIGDHWAANYGLPHTPRIWDMKELHALIPRVPICLNLIKGNWETALIIRHFEITAYGGFMLTYATDDLPECFDVGKECDVFRSEAELLAKIDHYLSHPEERAEIARAGQRRTLSEHLYSHRIIRLVDILREGGCLPARSAAAASTDRADMNFQPQGGAPIERRVTADA